MILGLFGLGVVKSRGAALHKFTHSHKYAPFDFGTLVRKNKKRF